MRITCCAIIAMTALCRGSLAAEDDLAQLAPLLEEGAVAVVRLELATLDGPALSRVVPRIPNRTPDERDAVVRYADTVRRRLLDLGATRVYAVLNAPDLGRAGHSWLIPTPEQTVARKVAAFLATGNADSTEDPEAATLGIHRRVAVRKTVVFCGHSGAFDRLGRVVCPPRPDLQTAFAAAGETPIAIAVVPTAAQQRVLQEFWPEFPAVSGTLPPVAAGSVQWLVVALDSANRQIRFQAAVASPESAKTLSAWAPAFLTWLDRRSTPDVPVDQALPAELLPADGPRISGRIPWDEPIVSRLLDRLCDGVFFAAESVNSVQSLKQLGLAMHVFYGKWNSFPPPASHSRDGQPLLSWRVFLLPHLGQEALYRQFHLDEPWDSPHNRTLIRQMPAVFGSDALDLNLEGKTTYLLPVADQTPFHGRTGTPISKISDGTSNTAMILQAAPQQAVIWTRPQDLAINWDRLDQLFPATYPRFRATFCDGSVHSNLNSRMPPDTLKRLLQHADAEPVDWETTR